MLLDTHHHFDFLPPAARPGFLRAVHERGVQVVAQTLLPSSFVTLVDGEGSSDGDDAPLWSLGLHPWVVTDDAQADRELAIFREALPMTRFIGEIGLDFSPRRLETAPAAVQLRVLRGLLDEVCRAANQIEHDRPFVLSLHAVRAVDELLDLLDELDVTGHGVVPICHQFQGTSDQLTRLVRLGGFLSIGPRMLASKRGRAYLRQVPAERLLLESDLPASPVAPGTDPAAIATQHTDELATLLHTTVDELSNLRRCDIAATLSRTQATLYGPLA